MWSPMLIVPDNGVAVVAGLVMSEIESSVCVPYIS